MDPADTGPHVIVTLDDEVPDEQREAIRSSVLVMARRSAEAARRAFEDNRESAELNRRLHAPIRELVEQHADAAAALAASGIRMESSGTTELPPPPDWPPVPLIDDQAARSTDFAA